MISQYIAIINIIFDRFFLIISFSVGATVLVLCLLDFGKTRDNRLKGIFITTLFLLGIHVISFASNYLYGTTLVFRNFSNQLSILNLICRSSPIFFVPFYFNCFLPNKWAKYSNTGFFMLHMLLVLFTYILSHKYALIFEIGFCIIFGAIAVYTVWMNWLLMKKIPDHISKNSKDAQVVATSILIFLGMLPMLVLTDTSILSKSLILDANYSIRIFSFLETSAFIISLMNRKKWISYDVLEILLLDNGNIEENNIPDNAPESMEEFFKLSPREAQISQYLLEEYSYKEIGINLDISVTTVKSHVINLYKKLDVNTRRDLRKKLHPCNLVFTSNRQPWAF